ncbi:MAG: Ribulosamine/erythrulosamine 3-kinase potentially involved in protein deglycation [uncultured Nocardioidaceae bacterium]|uniref:Ribulosamine/erythrulosamine 3-kinase potentially involved in protein deglycation n=1 Tax=uncultured Nocardioidaceae bacterium TaxID=253824 RepID=A0A6J4M7C9_9ACTN|nr:MAG: Ribulosamine/erythrulosamine 3-kinase potentially involved in protein deglycation [uncultured Nocardioidaceae bacterium]
MARAGTVARRAEALLGSAVVATAPVSGGSICTATRLRLSDGASALIKTRAQAPADFFPSEARGLRWLASTRGAGVPDVLAVEQDCLILTWVEAGRPGAEAAEAFGRALAVTHQCSPAVFGTDSGADGFIGILPMPNRAAESWPQFFATRRILPYLKLARDRSSISAEDAAAVESVVRRIVELAGPDEPPSTLHGDLWAGNVVWARDGRVWLVDPAAHGGHRETDLAMLTLFGLPHLSRVLDAYQELTPLAEGWEDRVALHQLFPLLVHACHFGGGYGARAGAAARSLL